MRVTIWHGHRLRGLTAAVLVVLALAPADSPAAEADIPRILSSSTRFDSRAPSPGDGSAPSPGDPDAPSPGDDTIGPAPAPPQAPAVFATIGRIALTLPSHHVRLLGYHEAATPAADSLAPQRAVAGHVLATRGRQTAPTSAADVAVDPNTPVLSPVSGIVVEVTGYRLYGRYDDTRIRIVPDADPRRVVTLLHVTGATVGVGQRVEAGATVVAAGASLFPFRSQIEVVAGRLPHVHIESRLR